MTKPRKRALVENLVERITVRKDGRVDFELHYVPGQSIVNSDANSAPCELNEVCERFPPRARATARLLIAPTT